jgi:hypothetical protein
MYCSQYPKAQRTTTPCSDSDSSVTSEGSRGTAAARTLTTVTTAMIQERDVLRHSLKCLEGRCFERRPDSVRYTQRRTLAL